jgi:predicted permease
MDTLRQDLVYALRSLRRQPGFTIVTVLTLALGIGANTAVFSVVNGVVLRPLGYPEPERLVYVTSQFPGLGFDQFWVSLPEFIEYRDRNQAFETIGAYNVGAVNLNANPPGRPVLALVTPELFPALGVKPLTGRWFTADDSVPNAEAVTILSWELWQRSFGGDPAIVNKTVMLNSAPNRVVGIMPRGFDVHDQRVEIWQPLTINPANFPNSRGGHFLYLVGRLKQGVSLGAAKADLDIRLEEWPKLNPSQHAPNKQNQQSHRLRMDPLKEDVVGGIRTALVVLQAAVGFVLLIACANLANLLIARADSRLREYAVRNALGASRGRLLRQLITEGLVLAGAGAIAGVGLAWTGLTLLLAASPNAIPRTAEITLDWRVLLFTLGVAVLTGLIFGLVPLAHIGRDRAGQAMRESGTRTTAGTARARLRSALVVAEVALAVVLVVGAGLLIRSFFNLTKTDMGFNRSQLSTFGIVLPSPAYDTVRRVDFLQRMTTNLRAIPGVQAVAAMTGLPPLRNVNANDTDFEHIAPLPPGQPRGSVPIENTDFWQTVTVGYTETMGIPVVRGRTFDDKDPFGAPVVLVNEALVRKFFPPDMDPIGKRLKRGNGANLPFYTIVGVLKDVKQGGVSEAVGTEVYFLAEQMPATANFAPSNLNIVVRSSLPYGSLAPQFRRVAGEIDPTLPLIRMRSMDDVVGDAIARPWFLTLLLGLFAGLALALAAVGTYGILSYLVAERQQEIGIRMALGADRAEILRMVLMRGLILSVIGLVGGLVGALGLTRVIKTLLYNVTPTDPLTLGIVAGVIGIVAVAACFVPAWRATRTDPMIVLRGA